MASSIRVFELRPPRLSALPRAARSGVTLAAAAVVAALILVALLAPLLAPYSPEAQDLAGRLQPPGGRHWLPNTLAPVIVAVTVGAAGVMLAEATLSFLGLGVQPPAPSWGSMMERAWEYRRAQPVQTLWPALALALAISAFNFLGDGLRD